MAASAASRSPGTAKAILTAGLLVGTLDLLGALANYFAGGGKAPIRVFQFIASGVFGKAAFSGGELMAAWGFLFHYLLAFAFTAFFFLLYPRVTVLAQHRLATGVAYGLLVWTVMNLAVVPLSGTPKSPFNPTQAAIGAGILVVTLGLPLSLLASRHFAARK